MPTASPMPRRHRAPGRSRRAAASIEPAPIPDERPGRGHLRGLRVLRERWRILGPPVSPCMGEALNHPLLFADMKAALTELQDRVLREKLAAIGFCFGGSMVWHLLAAAEPRLAAAAPFYGPFPEGGDLRGTRAAVLGVFGGQDARVNATLPEAEAALEAAHLKYELLTFSDAGHAFFNDTGARYDPHASVEAWRRALNWFDAAERRPRNG